MGGAIHWFNDRAVIEGKVEPDLSLSTGGEIEDGQMKWIGVEATSKLQLTLSLILKAVENLTASAYGGGEPKAVLHVPPEPSLVKELAFKIFTGVKLKAWRFERSFEASHEWKYEPTALLAANDYRMTYITDSGWHPVPRDYAADTKTYAIFRANDAPFSLLGNTGLLSTQETRIAENVYPYSEPAIASDGATMLLWVHDDISKPIMQGENAVKVKLDSTERIR